MTNHEFICQDPEIVYAIFQGLYDHLKEHHGINVNRTRYAGDRSQCTTDVASWLLLNKDGDAMAYVEYNADKNELNCRRINILEIDYKIPSSKTEDTSIDDVMLECMKKVFESRTVPYSTWNDVFKDMKESITKPQPTLKSMINSSMDEIMSELASMKQKAQPTMNKMERVYKAMMTELSKDD